MTVTAKDHEGRGWRLLVGDVLERLHDVPDGSVHTCVTSPPYFGLRDYGMAGQIGLEETPDAFVARLVEVFREVRRTLREDGTLWVNMGDSYNNTGTSQNGTGLDGKRRGGATGIDGATSQRKRDFRRAWADRGIKHKDLIGVPWLLAFALRADGWWLRSEIIWAKKAPMPESVRDRPTKAHEQIFLFAKSPIYFYDADAIKEEAKYGRVTVPNAVPRTGRTAGSSELWRNAGDAREGVERGRDQRDRTFDPSAGRNARSVWHLSAEPYPDAHFATFPSAIPERCIKAGTSEKGCCPACLAPWVRITEREKVTRERPNEYVKRTGESGTGNSCANTTAGVAVRTLGWKPSCECAAGDPIPCTVLEPFAGSGTTLRVARELGRHAVGIELNPQYAELAVKRITAPLGVTPSRPADVPGQRSLFSESA